MGISKQYQFIMKDLNCANCTGKIEELLRKCPEFTEIHYNFATQKLKVTINEAGFSDMEPEAVVADLVKLIQKITDSVESGVTVISQPIQNSTIVEPSVVTFKLENLTCAHCAGIIEDKLASYPEFAEVKFSLATQKLIIRPAAEFINIPVQQLAESWQDKIQEICNSVEQGVNVVIRTSANKNLDKLPHKLIFKLGNLLCPHCSGIIEEKIKHSDFIVSAKYTLATQKLSIELTPQFMELYQSRHAMVAALINRLQEICDSVESGVVVSEFVTDGPSASSTTTKSQGQSGWSGTLRYMLGKVWSYTEVTISLLLLLIVSFTSLIPNPYDNLLTVILFIFIARHIFMVALRNVKRGRWLDENILMLVATGGAIGLGDYKEALWVMLFYRIGLIFEESATNKSRIEIMSIIDMRPDEVVLIEGDSQYTVPANTVEVGQLVLVKAGDSIPLDGRVVSGNSQLDTSPVTGESKPVVINPGDEILSGCINLTGSIKLQVTKPLTESFVTKMLEAVESATATKPSVDRFITRFARWYTPLVLIIAGLTLIIPSIITGDWNYWIYTALTFLVISCPCALVLSIPLSFFAGIGGASKRGILFKSGIAMENTKNIKVIAMDKTGTLTKGEFSVEAIEVVKGSESEVLQYAGSCESISSHPIAKSIVDYASVQQISLLGLENSQEFAGEGVQATIGTTSVICGNRRLFSRLGITSPLIDIRSGYTEVLVAIAHEYYGRILIRDSLKVDAKVIVKSLQKHGYIVAMVTGDSASGANPVAEELGIKEVYSGLLPTQKLATLQRLRKKYGGVMFVGDGINDAPVLAGADVGGAMGSGADVALEAADIVFMNSEVSAVEVAIKLARRTIDIAWQNVILALGLKIIVMIIGFMGYASMWLAIFADTGVMVLCVMNALRLLYKK